MEFKIKLYFNLQSIANYILIFLSNLINLILLIFDRIIITFDQDLIGQLNPAIIIIK